MKKYNVDIDEYEEDGFNVDICVTCGGANPPTLPLREERISLGVEVIHNAKGVASRGVEKQRQELQAQQTKNQNRFSKLQYSKLIRLRKKKADSLKSENPLLALSYESYLKELDNCISHDFPKSIDERIEATKGDSSESGDTTSFTQESSVAETLSQEEEDGDAVRSPTLSIFSEEDNLSSSPTFEEDFLQEQLSSMSDEESTDDGYDKDIKILKDQLELDESSTTALATACVGEAHDISYRLLRCQNTHRLIPTKNARRHLYNHNKNMHELASACVEEVNNIILQKQDDDASSPITVQNLFRNDSRMTHTRYSLHVIPHFGALSHCAWLLWILKGQHKNIQLQHVFDSDLQNNINSCHSLSSLSSTFTSNKYPMLSCYDDAVTNNSDLKSDNGNLTDLLWTGNDHKVYTKLMQALNSSRPSKTSTDDCSKSLSNCQIDLFPHHLEKEIKNLMEWLQTEFMESIYKCGLAKTQSEYDLAIQTTTRHFDTLNDMLLSKAQSNGYLIQDHGFMTVVDLFLFCILLPWEDVYRICFKINTRSIVTTPALLNYMKNVYQELHQDNLSSVTINSIDETFDLLKIKKNFYQLFTTTSSNGNGKKNVIIPRGKNFIGLLQ